MKATRTYPKRGYTAFMSRPLKLNGMTFYITSDRAYMVDEQGRQRRAYKVMLPDPENPGLEIRATELLKRHNERCQVLKLDPFATEKVPTLDEVQAAFEQTGE